MPTRSDPLLMATYGNVEQRVMRSSYSWDSQKRGKTPFVILQLTKSGYGIYERDGRSQEVGPGYAFISLVPENARYYYPAGAGEPWVFSWINFEGEQGLQLWRWFLERYGSVFPLAEQSEARLILEGLLKFTLGKEPGGDFQVSAESYRFLMTLAAELEAGKRDPISAVREAARAMQRQPLRSIAVKEFAARAGLSREHFTRLFQRETGTSPARFRRERQMEMAADWLLRSDLSVQEIALRTGFTSGRQLTKMFGHFRGRSPLEFRRKKRSAQK